MTIIRVFPRRTRATPTGPLVRIGYPPPPACRIGAEEVHISVTFTWDKPMAEDMAESWKRQGYAVQIGGPAYGDPGGEFEPGRFLAPGYVITSRGCPNDCKWCLVPEREGRLRLLPIMSGWDVLDNNLLACPRWHVEGVLYMLSQQRHPARFTGGLEARRMEPWFVSEFVKLRLDTLFLAYDRPSEAKPCREAVRMIAAARPNWSPGTLRRKVQVYTLIGMEGDTISAAEARAGEVFSWGARCYPMYWRGEDATAKRPREWRELVGRLMRYFGGGRA